MTTRKATTSPHRFVGTHVDDLADGQVLEPGQRVELTDEQLAEPHNRRLIDEHLLIPIPVAKEER
jgi:hypothetical protein